MLLYFELRIQGIKYFCLTISSRFWEEMCYFLVDQNDHVMIFLEFGQTKISFKNDIKLKEMEKDGTTTQPWED